MRSGRCFYLFLLGIAVFTPNLPFLRRTRGGDDGQFDQCGAVRQQSGGKALGGKLLLE